LLRGYKLCFRLRSRTLLLHDFNRNNDLNRSDETIPMAWQRYDEPWVLGIIPQRLAQFLHGSVNAVFKVNEGIGGPKLLPELFPCHHFTGPLEEHGEDLEGAFLKLDLLAISA
jgi:hypothetical protein